MSKLITFPDKYINQLGTFLMLDDTINKMLCYTNTTEDDILSLPEVKEPIKKLNDKKIFIDRRVNKLFDAIFESDCYIFLNMYKDEPASLNNGKTSSFISSFRLDIGVVCHNSCSNTLNGSRDVIIYKRINEILREDERLEAIKEVIGKPIIGTTSQNYSIPIDYNTYITSVTVRYFNEM
jgi:hypothetical protein|nr:MAG TPA: hypothetical protein [Caudoviricetes sp.]